MAFVASNLYSVSQQVWLGIKSTALHDKSFHWDGIDPVLLTYSFWDSTSPRGSSPPNDDRKCVAAHWGNAQTTGEFYVGQWRDYPCDDTNQDINPSQSSHSYVCSMPYQSGETKSYPNHYKCPDGWIPRGESCYLWTNTKMDYDSALQYVLTA